MIKPQNKNDMDSGPWYKEPWPWILMAGPAIVVVAGFITFYLAVATDDTLVSDDYYKDGKNIIKQMNRDTEASNRQLHAKLVFNEDVSSVRILINGKIEQKGKITLNIHHPTMKKRDKSIELKPLGQNIFQANFTEPITKDQARYWYLSLEDEGKQWRLQSKWSPSADKKEIDLIPAIGNNKIADRS